MNITFNLYFTINNFEFGSVTLESAGYVARYAAKKLAHGKDDEHDYHPIHRTSCKRAIGRSWIEKYYQHTFDHGLVVLPNGQKSKIPRSNSTSMVSPSITFKTTALYSYIFLSFKIFWNI